jgi:hypothetical protein
MFGNLGEQITEATGRSLDTPEGLEKIIIRYKELERLNSYSIDNGYNKNLEMSELDNHLYKQIEEEHPAMGDITADEIERTAFVLEPIMIHQHKQGKPCKDHYRCWVHIPAYFGLGPFLDIPKSLYISAAHIEDPRKQ